MGDHQNGLADALVQVAQNFQDSVRILRVEIAGGFVRQQQSRLIDQRAGDGNALLFAAGESARFVLEPILDAEQFQRLFEIGGTRFDMRDVLRERDVVGGGQGRQQVVLLKDKAYFALAQFGAFPILSCRAD